MNTRTHQHKKEITLTINGINIEGKLKKVMIKRELFQVNEPLG